MLKYAKPQDEILLDKAIRAISQEFGPDKLIISLPREWQPEGVEKDLGGTFRYDQEDTIKVQARNASAVHLVQLVQG